MRWSLHIFIFLTRFPHHILLHSRDPCQALIFIIKKKSYIGRIENAWRTRQSWGFHGISWFYFFFFCDYHRWFTPVDIFCPLCDLIQTEDELAISPGSKDFQSDFTHAKGFKISQYCAGFQVTMNLTTFLKLHTTLIMCGFSKWLALKN